MTFVKLKSNTNYQMNQSEQKQIHLTSTKLGKSISVKDPVGFGVTSDWL